MSFHIKTRGMEEKGKYSVRASLELIGRLFCAMDMTGWSGNASRKEWRRPSFRL